MSDSDGSEDTEDESEDGRGSEERDTNSTNRSRCSSQSLVPDEALQTETSVVLPSSEQGPAISPDFSEQERMQESAPDQDESSFLAALNADIGAYKDLLDSTLAKQIDELLEAAQTAKSAQIDSCNETGHALEQTEIEQTSAAVDPAASVFEEDIVDRQPNTKNDCTFLKWSPSSTLNKELPA